MAAQYGSPVAREVPPGVPEPETRLPTFVLWLAPFLLVLAYVVLVTYFFHSQARWSGAKWIEVTELLVITTALFSLVWYGVAYGASLLFGEYGSVAILQLITRIPKLNRHVIVQPPARADTRSEVWGRFGILLLVLLGYELVVMLLVVKRGDLAPHLAIGDPIRFFVDELLAGLALGLLIAPAAPFVAGRIKLRITDSLEFPYLWLALILLVIGGASTLVYEVLPGFLFDPALFLTSILLYAPAAWFVGLAFSRTEAMAQRRFLARAWAARGPKLHFGRLKVTDVPEGSVNEV
jgi:hypothetical protein